MNPCGFINDSTKSQSPKLSALHIILGQLIFVNERFTKFAAHHLIDSSVNRLRDTHHSNKQYTPRITVIKTAHRRDSQHAQHNTDRETKQGGHVIRQNRFNNLHEYGSNQTDDSNRDSLSLSNVHNLLQSPIQGFTRVNHVRIA
nr:MAG TPA: hypothetical protein [Caudoviricetes sp.]